MGESTAIAWCDHTFNPWWGCSRVSDGCTKCYAESFSKRVGHGKRLPTIWGVDAERKPMSEAYWREPAKWNRKAADDGLRRRVFCASMADVFEIPSGRNEQAHRVMTRARGELFRLIERTTWLDWLLLTKRPENVRMLAPWGGGLGPWPKNVWLGVTAEDQRRADERVHILVGLGAHVRFVSHEPALERVDFSRWLGPNGVHWVITGGESGPGARTYDIDWARDVVEQCRRGSAAAFVKQLGARPFCSSAGAPIDLRDRKGGDPEEWPIDLRVQEVPR